MGLIFLLENRCYPNPRSSISLANVEKICSYTSPIPVLAGLPLVRWRNDHQPISPLVMSESKKTGIKVLTKRELYAKIRGKVYLEVFDISKENEPSGSSAAW